MDFGLAFSFVYEDEDWLKKIVLASVLCLTVIGIIPVLGWGLEVIRRVIKDDPETLPDWGEFGQYFVKGLLVLLTLFVYFLPIIIIGSCNAGTGSLLNSTGEDIVVPVIWILTMCLSCVYIIYWVGVSLIIPAALGNYANSGEFGSVFKLGEIFRIVRGNLGNYGLVFLGMFLSYIVVPLGVIACGVGIFFTTSYAILFNSHLMGQAFKIAAPGEVVADAPIPGAN